MRCEAWPPQAAQRPGPCWWPPFAASQPASTSSGTLCPAPAAPHPTPAAPSQHCQAHLVPRLEVDLVLLAVRHLVALLVHACSTAAAGRRRVSVERADVSARGGEAQAGALQPCKAGASVCPHPVSGPPPKQCGAPADEQKMYCCTGPTASSTISHSSASRPLMSYTTAVVGAGHWVEGVEQGCKKTGASKGGQQRQQLRPGGRGERERHQLPQLPCPCPPRHAPSKPLPDRLAFRASASVRSHAMCFTLLANFSYDASAAGGTPQARHQMQQRRRRQRQKLQQ